MKIAVIGSREGFTYEDVDRVLGPLLTNINDTVVTGGARGIDSYAMKFCELDATPCEVIRPINPSNKLDYLFRNIEIITKADKIVAFWDGSSRGTKFVIDYAKARNKELIIIKPKKLGGYN